MKTTQLCAIMGCILLMACQTKNVAISIKDFIPGIYARVIDHEFARGNDTLEINLISAENNSYQVEKKTVYQRIINKKLQPHKERIVKRWIVFYDEKNKVLDERKDGVFYTFDPVNERMLIGKSIYQKVN